MSTYFFKEGRLQGGWRVLKTSEMLEELIKRTFRTTKNLKQLKIMHVFQLSSELIRENKQMVPFKGYGLLA